MSKLSRIVSVGSLFAATVALAGCSVTAKEYVKGTPVKVGLICLHDSQSTYDKNFIDAMGSAVKDLGEKVDGEAIIKTGVKETNDAYNAAKDLVKQGCNVIFADSFGHEAFILKAAKEWPQVTFCHATGTKAKTEKVSNFHNAFASIYEGRYLAGYAAGLKLSRMYANNELGQNNFDANGNIKLGYVGAFPYAEVVSGYTSWFLGVKSVVDNVVMDVTFTNSWYDVNAEKDGASTLAQRGAAIISQHADSMGAPGQCEELGIPNVTYNVPLASECPNTYLAYSKIDWAPYYKAVITSMYEGKAIEGEVNNNYTGTLATGSVIFDCVDNDDKLLCEAVKAELELGTRKVFDCNTFTVKNAKADTSKYSKANSITMDESGHLTSYIADVDDAGDFVPETEVIKTVNGITFFDESALRSAPYFDVDIDGITKLN